MTTSTPAEPPAERPTEPPADAERTPGRVARARQRVRAVRADVERRGDDLQARLPVARDAVAAYEHDRQVGGEIMAGAIAFRVFIFLLPFTFVLIAGLGIVADLDPQGSHRVVDQLGVGGLAAKSVSESARLDSGGRWIAFGVGAFALYFASIALARAMRIAHALAWQEAVAPLRRAWRSALILIGTICALLVVFAVTSRIRESSPGLGLAANAAMIIAFAVAWFGLSLLLPHRSTPWTALLPGTAIVGIGIEALHVATVYYFSRKVSSSSSLYGPIGGAIGILLWAYFFGRLTVASAVINATYWHRHHPAHAPATSDESRTERDAGDATPPG